MIKPVATVSVVPDIPESLARLNELAYNLRWSWDHETYMLFRRIDSDLWEKTYHNPVLLLGLVSQERLTQCINDAAFMANYHRVVSEFDAYMNSTDTWYQKNHQPDHAPIIAYFSMEFGLAESLQNYSGGLGILSGDHMKSASDLGLPLVGVGLLYQEGYFQQYLNADGYQQENYPINDYANLPVILQRHPDGKPILIDVDLPGRKLYAQIWKVNVGRVSLYLMDTNIAQNPRPEDRNITDRLYGGDKRQRIRQEILLGIGGIRALNALKLKPHVCHMNEGHSAFLALERIRNAMEDYKISFWQAREITRATNIFTTHTNVPAGLERFGYDLIDEHFTDYYRSMGLSREQFIGIGRENMGDYELYSMAVLALNLSADSNGVAQLHGKVAREMWQWMYPGVPAKEVPLGAITNGIHTQTWVAREMGTLFDRYLDPTWRSDESDPGVWKAVDNIPDGELWRTHERRRERLVAFARMRLREQLTRRGVPQSEIEAADEALNPDALTIGFARRFATYKRATLLFRDVERIKRLLNNPDRPVQIIFAGKAHPHDEEGKAFIRHIIHMARMPELRHSIVFLENYDMLVARYLVQGVDVWLNNPRRPKEASGTSGMKAIYNGGLNCSILDGWWDEAYSPEVGWAIGNGEQYRENQNEQADAIESQALYNILEQDIIPTFYERGRDGLPREWLRKMKNALRDLAPVFNTYRMVREYAAQYYLPTFERAYAMTHPDLKAGIDYAAWRSNIDIVWRRVQVRAVQVSQESVKVGAEVEVHTTVYLGDLKPKDVRVQLVYGGLDTNGSIGDDSRAIDMTLDHENGNGEYQYVKKVNLHTTGERGVSVRIVPHHEYLPTSFQPGLITWA